MKKIIFLFLLLPNIILSQSFKYSSGGNPIDGEYKFAYVSSYEGGEFPYQDATIYLNKLSGGSTNLYISGTGFYMEDFSEVQVYFVFDEEDDIYISTTVSYSSDNESIFVSSFRDSKTGVRYDRDHILAKLKESNSLYMRVEDSGVKNDYMFDLSGSAKAIAFVLE